MWERIEDERAIEKLRLSEERYRNLIELAPDSIITVALSGIITSCNSAAVDLTGYSKEELVGKHFSKTGAIRVEDITKFTNRFEDLAKGRALEPFELMFYRKDGIIRWGEARVSLVKMGDKRLEVQTILRDITRRKEAEKALHESEAIYSALVRHAKVGVLIVQDQAVKFANDASAKLFGFTPDELTGMHIGELVTPEERNKLINLYNLRMSGEKVPSVIEIKIRCKDSSIREVELSASMIQYQGQSAAMGILFDITERKQIETVLRESEQKYKELADSLPQVVFQADPQGNLTFVNQNAFTMFGYTSQDFENGINAIQTVIREDRKRAQENMRNLMSGEQIESHEYTALRKDGTTFPISITSSPIIHNNTPVGIRGIIVDISELKRVEKALRVSEEKFRLI